MSEATFASIVKSSPDAIYDLCFAPTINLNAYGGHPIQTKCSFKAWVEVVGTNKPRTFAEFIVVGGSSQNLMGYQTSKKIKVVKVGLAVNNVTTSEQTMELIPPHPSNINSESTSGKVKPFPKMPGVMLSFQIRSDIAPVKSARRNIPLSMQTFVNERLSKMLQLGILEKAPKASKWISPMHVVPKANGDTRIVIDMRQPNRAIDRFNHSMPLIEEIWDKFQGAKHFTKYDLKDAFHHLEIDEQSRELTTFMSDLGMLRYTRLAFGVSCAPELFQREMERVLQEFKEFCVIFLDDILVFADTEKSLLERQTLIEHALSSNNLTINEAKTVRNAKETEFLGFLIKDGSITPTTSKTEAIENFQIPKTIKDLRSFLGMVNHLHLFIPNLAEKVEPLRTILRQKKGNVLWGEAQSEAFSKIKIEIGKHLSPRKIFDVSCETIIYTDASPYALGAVLVQKTGQLTNGNADEKMIACASKTLTDVERRYSQTQREALAAVWGIERFYYFLMGRKFTLRTDANALRFIYKSSPQETKRVLNRADGWALRLEPYNFDVEYVKGESNIADPFSRLYTPISKPIPFENENEPHILCFVKPHAEAIDKLLAANNTNIIEMMQLTNDCPEFKALKLAIKTGYWTSEVDVYKAFEDEYLYSGHLLWRSGKLIVPKPLRSQFVEHAHRSHATYACTLSLIAENFWWPEISKDIINCIKNCSFCNNYGCLISWHYETIDEETDDSGHVFLVRSNENDIPNITMDRIKESQRNEKDLQNLQIALENNNLKIFTEYKHHIDNIYLSKGLLLHQDQFVAPKDLRLPILDAAHKAHPGKNTMIRSISRYFWWPCLAKDVEKYTKCCASCTRMRRPEPPEPICSTTMPAEPWIKIAIDFFSAPMDLKSKILVIKDYYSRYLITKLVSSENSQETTDALDSVFKIFGKPLILKSDNGPPFQSASFRSWSTEKGIEHIHSTPLSPRQNGMVERAMQGIKKALTAAKIEGRNFNQALNEYVDAYNSWPHAVTLMSPADLMFARAFRGDFPMTYQAEILEATQEEIFERDRIGKLKSKLYQDRVMQAKMRDIKIGDEVYILKKGETKLTPRFGVTKLRVIAKNGSQLTLQTGTGEVILRSVEHATKCVTDKDIENYLLEKQNAAPLSQKSLYEENKPILVEANARIGNSFVLISFFVIIIFFLLVDGKEDDPNMDNSTDLRRSSRTIRMPKRYIHTINNVEVYIPISED